MKALKLESLQESDISYPSNASNTEFVINWPNDLSSQTPLFAMSHLQDNAPTIRSMVKKNGAVLIRNLPFSSASTYQQALENIGYDLLESNYGGASPRSNVTKKTFVSTEAPAPFIIGYHTEFCYQVTRPEMISFFCINPGQKHSETPIFDCAKTWNSLSEELQEKLETYGLIYKRFFPGKKSKINFRKTWYDTFQTQNKHEVESFLESEDMNFKWHSDNSLSTELHIPAMLQNNITGKKQLSVTMFNLHSLLFNLNHFKSRYNPILHALLKKFLTYEYSKENIFLQVLSGNSMPFTREESEEIQRAIWQNAIVFPWQPNDLLILDNIQFAHARLNVKKPREIIAAMSGQYSVRDYCGNDSVSTEEKYHEKISA